MKVPAALLFMFASIAFGQSVQPFHDDRDGRVVGAVETMDSRVAGQPSLALRFLAEHHSIEPELGWEHIHGFNRNSAFQLNVLSMKEGRLSIVARPAKGGPDIEARRLELLRGDHRGHVRRPDGTFAYHQVLAPNLVSGLEVRGADPLPPGDYEVDVWAYGERRMTISMDHAKQGLRITGVESFGHGDKDKARGSFPEDQVPVADAEQPVRDPVAPKAWAKLDELGKWAAFHADKAKHPDQVGDWGDFLRRQKDEAFMEDLAIYERGAFETLSLGTHLQTMESDRWIRLASWHYQAGGGHMASVSETLLGDPTNAPSVLAWFDKYPEEAKPETLNSMLNSLRKNNKPAKQVTGRPPLDAKTIYHVWFDPKAGANDEAFERALEAFLNRNRFLEPYYGRFLELLTDEPDFKRRQSALLACSRVKQAQVPLAILEEVINNPDEDKRLREAAVLGLKNAPKAYLFVVTHEVLGQPSHPGWSAAVAYIGEFGTPYSLDRLKELKGLNVAQKIHVGISVAQIEKRPAPNLEQTGTHTRRMGKLVEAMKRKSSILPTFRPYVLEPVRQIKGGKLFESVEKVMKGRIEKNPGEAPFYKELLSALDSSTG